MGWWSDIWRQRAASWPFIALPDTHVPNGPVRRPLRPNQEYVSITLRSMRLAYVRKGLTRFYGVVHSAIEFSDVASEDGRAELQTLVSPAALRDVAARDADRVIPLSHRLLHDVPFRGGDIDLEVGLFSIRSADLAQPFLDLLEEVAGLAGISYVTAALPFARLLKLGVGKLTGGDRDSLDVGVAGFLQPRETGAYLAWAGSRADIAGTKLDEDYLLRAVAKPASHFVLTVEAQPRREAWFEVPELQKSYAHILRHVRGGDIEAARKSFSVFEQTVRGSPDLLQRDAERLVVEVERSLGRALGPTQTGGWHEPSNMPELRDVDIYGPGTA